MEGENEQANASSGRIVRGAIAAVNNAILAISIGLAVSGNPPSSSQYWWVPWFSAIVCVMIDVVLVVLQVRASNRSIEEASRPSASASPPITFAPVIHVHSAEDPSQPPTTQPPNPPVPDQPEQPPLPKGVVPREEELKQLDKLYNDNDVVVVVGRGGQGKTTFASLHTHQWLGKRSWHTVDRTGDEIVTNALRHLGVDFERKNYSKAGDLSRLLVSTMRASPESWLIVIDDLEEDDLDSERHLKDGELAELLEQASGGLERSRLLLTSRVMPKCKGYNQPARYQLDRLDQEQSVELLTRRLTSKELPADLLLEAAGAGYADGYPFALTLLADLLNECTTNPTTYLQRLLADPNVWYEEGRGLLDKVWAELTTSQQQALQFVAIFSRPVTAETIAGMLSKLAPPLALDHDALDELTRRNLIEVSEAEAYALHPLLRHYVYNKLPGQASYHRAAASHFRSQYTRDPHTNPPHSVAEVQPLLDGFDQLCAAGDYEEAAILLMGTPLEYMSGGGWINLNDMLDRWGEYGRLAAMNERIVNAPPDTLQESSRGHALSNLGNAYFLLGENQQAIDYLQQALTIAEQISDIKSKVRVLGNLGFVYHRLGENQQAIDYLQQALTIAEQIGDIRSKSRVLGELGVAYRSLGEFQRAIDCSQQALIIAEQIGDIQGKGNQLGNLGSVYFLLGEYQQTIDYSQQALTIAEQIGDIRSKGRWLGILGVAYHSLGEYQQAIGYFQLALTIAEQIGELSGQGHQWNDLGVAYRNLKSPRNALACYLKALLIRESRGSPVNVADTKGNIEDIHAAMSATEWETLHAEAERLAADPNWRPWQDDPPTSNVGEAQPHSSQGSVSRNDPPADLASG